MGQNGIAQGRVALGPVHPGGLPEGGLTSGGICMQISIHAPASAPLMVLSRIASDLET